MNHAQFWGGGGAAPYEIEQSLRFNSADSAYLSRTPSSAGNRKTWTWSGWIKSNSVDTQRIFQTGTTLGTGNYFGLSWQNSGKLFLEDAGGFQLYTTALHRDPSAWYHIVVAVDTTQATSTNRIKLYVNGVQRTSFSTETYPGQNTNTSMNNTVLHYIGAEAYSGPRRYLDGYLAEINLIDGSALDPEDFGEFDDNGVWRPIEYTGSHGTQGFYLKFDPSATNGIGHDHSGNGNNFTANNFSTSGTGTDVMSDTPTTNWCTLNPLSFGPSNADMYEGNLRFDQPTSSTGNAKGTIAVSSGKWYWEVTPQTTATANVAGGILGAAETDIANQPGNYATGYSYYSTGETRHNNVDATYGASYGAGDVIGTALDLDAGTLVFYKNGVSQGTAYSSLSGTFVPAIGDTSTGSSSALVCNFGQREFAYTPPTGFSALNTSNLPAPDIADGSEYFKPLIYLPDGSSSFSVTGVGFQPDLVWIKSRNYTEDHQLNDAVRGATKGLQSNLTNAETTQTNGLTSFDSDGFTVGNLSDYNYNGDSIISWNWLASNTSGSSNTDGTITSTVSANPTAGFSIITYTGNGTYGATVGHGLGVAPSMAFLKNRDGGEWIVYNKVIGATKNLVLQDINRAGTYSGWFNDTEPTSTVLTLGGEADVNRLNDDIVAYCFAEVEGYNKFGSYTGNGSASDGPFVYCGLKPAMVIIKNITTNSNWIIRDSARSPYNQVHPSLYPNLSDSEINNFPMDFLANGFKIRDDNGVFNTSGDEYIFMCFAENPFGGDGVSPATAR